MTFYTSNYLSHYTEYEYNKELTYRYTCNIYIYIYIYTTTWKFSQNYLVNKKKNSTESRIDCMIANCGKYVYFSTNACSVNNHWIFTEITYMGTLNKFAKQSEWIESESRHMFYKIDLQNVSTPICHFFCEKTPMIAHAYNDEQHLQMYIQRQEFIRSKTEVPRDIRNSISPLSQSLNVQKDTGPDRMWLSATLLKISASELTAVLVITVVFRHQ